MSFDIIHQTEQIPSREGKVKGHSPANSFAGRSNAATARALSSSSRPSLRANLHTLFNLGLVSIQPSDRKVNIKGTRWLRIRKARGREALGALILPLLDRAMRRYESTLVFSNRSPSPVQGADALVAIGSVSALFMATFNHAARRSGMTNRDNNQRRPISRSKRLGSSNALTQRGS
jgi:hypothetical protein